MTAAASGVPDRPLPLVRHTRLAVVGDGSARTLALEAALRTTGRSISRRLLSDIVDRSSPLEADVVVFSCQVSEILELGARLSEALAGVVVVCSMLAEPPAGPVDATRGDKSAVATVSAALPSARVVGALQQFTDRHFTQFSLGLLQSDAPVTGDDREAVDLVEAILDEVAGLDAVFAGALRGAAAIEALAGILHSVEQQAGVPLGFRLDPAMGVVFLPRH
jgi:predicted dinucleotide-binding enzyme